jgi:lipid-A-disaccharide synthase
MSSEVVIVAGELSGDRIAAGIAGELARRDVRSFGMGGTASARAGVELLVDFAPLTGMGTTELVGRLARVARAYAVLRAALRRRRPRAAVLVDYTEFNLRLGRWLRSVGVPVLWCVAPQIWAWRPRRAPAIARALDRLAVILPFEERLWRNHGVDARYVGHPALEIPSRGRAEARDALGLPAAGPSVALMPGSRPHEIDSHLPILLKAFDRLRRARPNVEGCLLLASGSRGGTQSGALDIFRRPGLRTVDVDPATGAGPLLSAFDAAVVVSGTATLECALAAACPIVVYRASALTAALARRLLTTRFVALPNVLLEEPKYEELLQERCEPEAIARAVAAALDEPERARDGSLRLRARLAPPTPHPGAAGLPPSTVAEHMSSLLAPWIS